MPEPSPPEARPSLCDIEQRLADWEQFPLMRLESVKHYGPDVDALLAELRELQEALREWRELADLPGGGYGGTLEQRTDALLADSSEEPAP